MNTRFRLHQIDSNRCFDCHYNCPECKTILINHPLRIKSIVNFNHPRRTCNFTHNYNSYSLHSMPAPATTTPAGKKTTPTEKAKVLPDSKKVQPEVALEDDDDFEDFPAEPWTDADQELGSLHQWEDTWEDDDEAEDLAIQLKAEEKKRGVAPMRM
ncbi:26S proteasome complex subunit SEM1 [Batrachochytrium dendrobatidis]